MNSYILYRAVHHHEVAKRLESLGIPGCSNLISKILGDQWSNRLPPAQKEFFIQKATEEETLHREVYPWYRYDSDKKKRNNTAGGKKECISDMNLPGYLNMGDVMRDYHQFLQNNGFAVIQPVPAGDSKGLSQYNIPEYYNTILVDPIENGERKRKRSSPRQSRKARKTHQSQSPATAATAQNAFLTPPQRQVEESPKQIQMKTIRVHEQPTVYSDKAVRPVQTVNPHITDHPARVVDPVTQLNNDRFDNGMEGLNEYPEEDQQIDSTDILGYLDGLFDSADGTLYGNMDDEFESPAPTAPTVAQDHQDQQDQQEPTVRKPNNYADHGLSEPIQPQSITDQDNNDINEFDFGDEATDINRYDFGNLELAGPNFLS
ncbi:hypothetical protein F4818DRAFT_437798 [Hypoxylon cercidicola]|nr:hypothetical protein F4818DRAFT_437798 [Hypoxylon cercidicola]